MNIDNPKLIKQLESLVDNRQDWLFRFAYIRIGQREDAEDIVQEVLLAAFKKLKEGQQVEELVIICMRTFLLSVADDAPWRARAFILNL